MTITTIRLPDGTWQASTGLTPIQATVGSTPEQAVQNLMTLLELQYRVSHTIELVRPEYGSMR